MPKISLIVFGLLLAACGPAEDAKLPGGASPSGGGSAGGTSGSGGIATNPFAGAGGAGTAGAAGNKGGSGGTNPFGGSTGGSGVGGKAGDAGAGTGGRGGSGGSAAGGTPADGSAIFNLPIPPGAEPCANPKDISGGNTGNFGTTGPFCFRTCDEIQGWGCPNSSGRTVKVNGKEVQCGDTMPGRVGPFYYFDISAGALDYASVYWFGTLYGVPAGGYKKWDGSSASTSTTTSTSTTSTTTSSATASVTGNATSTTTGSATATATSGATATPTSTATKTATGSGV
jgi:hypothetical protein